MSQTVPAAPRASPTVLSKVVLDNRCWIRVPRPTAGRFPRQSGAPTSLWSACRGHASRTGGPVRGRACGSGSALDELPSIPLILAGRIRALPLLCGTPAQRELDVGQESNEPWRTTVPRPLSSTFLLHGRASRLTLNGALESRAAGSSKVDSHSQIAAARPVPFSFAPVPHRSTRRAAPTATTHAVLSSKGLLKSPAAG